MAEDTKDTADQPKARPLPEDATVRDLRRALLVADEAPTGPNVSTEPEKPGDHFTLAADGKTKLNAWGEEKGSDDDKRRMAGLGWA